MLLLVCNDFKIKEISAVKKKKVKKDMILEALIDNLFEVKVFVSYVLYTIEPITSSVMQYNWGAFVLFRLRSVLESVNRCV